MMNMVYLIIAIITLVYAEDLLVAMNTQDPEFVRVYQANRTEEGDNINFPKAGDRVIVHYIGTFPDTGLTFDSSIDTNTPFSFILKRGEVIQCWDEVVSRMSQGEKIEVICPARFAYGERGIEERVPPNTDIAFTIQLLSIETDRTEL